MEEFVAAYHNGTLKKLPSRPDQNKNIDWSTRKRVGEQRDLDHLPGPRSVSFGGLRFRVDRKTQYLSWLGWGLYLGFDRDMGMSLWDIRFRGERIIYEVEGIMRCNKLYLIYFHSSRLRRLLHNTVSRNSAV